MSVSKMRILMRGEERKIVFCLLMAVFTFVSTGFTSKNLYPVRILVDDRTIETHTTKLSPEQIFRSAGVELGESDEYLLRTVGGETEIIVYRAVPVTVEYEGVTNEFMTSKTTVEEALINLGYNLANYDVEPGLDTRISNNLNILLTTSEAALAAREAEGMIANEEAGSRAAWREFEAQHQRELPSEVYGDFSEDDYTAQIETYRGTERYQAALIMEASAYLPSDGGGSGVTATGMMAGYGVAAVDPSVIPLGSRLYIPGYGEAIAADTGGAIVGHKIDLCMEDYGAAMQFGRRDVTVYVLY
jgi:3D (Asp-Asp-Asp) domain-containing protein